MVKQSAMQMNVKLYPHALCRTPLLSYDAKLEAHWDELKTAIKEVSPDLYVQIEFTAAEEFSNLPGKIRFACWKYFNRARYRATPFGRFGAFTSIPLREKTNGQIIISTIPTLHRFTDWSVQDTQKNQGYRSIMDVQRLLSNSSYYRCADAIRYLGTAKDGFELNAVQYDVLVADLLSYCSEIRTKSDVIRHLIAQHQLNNEEALALLQELVVLQLLLTDLHPNITGTDYFSRINQSFSTTSNDYILAERKRLNGYLERSSAEKLAQLNRFLHQHLEPGVSPALQQFKNAFIKKFESDEVSISEALDPEIGVGYGALESIPGRNELIEELKQEKGRSLTINYSPFYQFLLEGILDGSPIKLEQYQATQPLNTAVALPNTFSVLLQQIDGQLIINEMGGATANALLGRFSLASKAIEQHAKDLASIEAASNPEIVFFDLAYLAETKVDNINRRKQLMDYELPILCWPGGEGYLAINDMVISVRGGELVLRSKKLGKRLIPRLNSAYNYHRSDLSLYRFLCDVQHEQLHTSLSLKLPTIFPNLPYYPRVTYQNIVVSSASWKLPPELHEQPTEDAALSLLSNWLGGHKIDGLFKAGIHDQYLYIDSKNKDDLRYFLRYAKNIQYISEAFLPKNPDVIDQEGRPYLNEFIFSLYHQAPIYRPIPTALDSVKQGLSRLNQVIFLPGSEWLYFEVYVHPIRANELLVNILPFILTKVKVEIKQWFFIRYNSPDPHIRIRFNMKEASRFGLVLQAFNEALSGHIEHGLVQDVQIKAYRREIERYGFDHIVEVERFFCDDSAYVCTLLKQAYSDNKLYQLTLSHFKKMLNHVGYTVDQQYVFIAELAQAFAKEMALDTKLFKKINVRYQEIKENDEGHNLLPTRATSLQDTLGKTLLHFKLSMQTTRFNKLLADLFHMHVNRLFPSDQRHHETLLYQFMLKALQEARHSKGRFF